MAINYEAIININDQRATPVLVISSGMQKQLLQTENGSKIEMPKNGYLYVFVSNDIMRYRYIENKESLAMLDSFLKKVML